MDDPLGNTYLFYSYFRIGMKIIVACQRFRANALSEIMTYQFNTSQRCLLTHTLPTDASGCYHTLGVFRPKMSIFKRS